jgi:superfamily II DNA/RNA helicase
MYFNALRELGGAIVQVLDDVPDSMLLYSKLRNELTRELDAPKELTSRVSQREIVSILADLSQPYSAEGFVDVVLATNMVSVGVDVPRLGLMLVNGQPKTRAEYIQSTSRVGRSSYPGLVICLYNAMKARDRSHFETFASVHQTLYRDVEATSVTPFASRSRDRALKAVLISMIRHSDPTQHARPDFNRLNIDNLQQIISEIERRVSNIDPSVGSEVSREIDEALNEWSSREIRSYLDNSVKGIRTSLLQYAEDFARRIASGNFGGSAWPIMNTMRSVEASTPFRLKEKIFKQLGPAASQGQPNSQNDATTYPWRRPNGSQ